MGSTEAMEYGGADSGPAVLNCIDLSDPDVQKSVSLLKQACTDSGFFYVINHGISQDFMDEVFFQSKRFFALPIDGKMKLLRNEKHRGYTPILDETLDPDKQINGDYKEGYYIGVEVPDGHPQAEKPFYGPNLWPSEDLLPGWRRTMELFHQEALRVAKAVAKTIALALELEDDFFDRPVMLGEPIATLRLLHYEGKLSDPQKGIYGAGAHTDYGLITLLATDDVPGLQICKDKDAQPQIWEHIEPIKGGFIVNLGDMLERWSNCIFRSTLHRVVVNAEERYSLRVDQFLSWSYPNSPVSFKDGIRIILSSSLETYLKIAFFVEPSHECLVECLPCCKSETNPPKFPPVTCSTYLSQRYSDTHRDLKSYH